MVTQFDVGEVVNIRAIVTGIIITEPGKVLYEVNLRSASGFGVTQVIEESQIVKEVQSGSKTGCNYQGCEQESKGRDHN